MSRFSGPQGRGAGRKLRTQLREEAEERNARYRANKQPKAGEIGEEQEEIELEPLREPVRVPVEPTPAPEPVPA